MQINSQLPGARSLGERLWVVSKLAIPAAATMMSYSMVGMVDTLMVGHLGPAALAAVGLSNTLLYALSALINGLVSAATPLAAQHVGAGQPREAGRYLHQATWVALAGGLVVGAILYFGGHAILTVLKTGDEIAAVGGRYLQIRALGLPFFYLLVARDHFLEGTGDTRTPMKVSLLVNIVNAVLNYLLIFAPFGLPSLGTDGSAWATVLAHTLSAVVYSFALHRRHEAHPELEIRPMQRPEWTSLRELVRVGWPMSVQFSLDIGAWLVMTIFMAWMSTNAQAANQVTLRILSVTFMTVHGVSVAGTTLVGQHLGAGDMKEARRYAWAAMIVGLGLTFLNGAVYLAWPELLVRAFTDDPVVTALACQLLAIGALMQVVETVSIVTYGALKGAGDTRYPMLVSIGTAWGVGIPASWLLAHPLGFGPEGVYLGLCVQLLVCAALELRRLLGDRWHLSALVKPLIEGLQPEQEGSSGLRRDALSLEASPKGA